MSESTSSNEIIGWSYQQTQDGKLYNMTQDNEWRQLYKSRYVNERVESELVEFKDEIERKFKVSKCKDFKFPRIDKSQNKPTRNHQTASYTHNSHYQSNENSILQGKNVIFDYKNEGKDSKKISRKNINFIQDKQGSRDLPPKKMVGMKTIDEDITRQKLAKSVPRNASKSKTKRVKHKRQIT